MSHRSDFGMMVKELMGRHGLLEAGWYYAYDTAKRRLGQCQYRNQILSFSLPFIDINTLDTMRDTVLHEIAHALVGPRHHHDYIWKMKAREVGAVARACAMDPNIKRPQGDYVFMCQCPTNNTHYFHRQLTNPNRMCRRCGHSGKVYYAP